MNEATWEESLQTKQCPSNAFDPEMEREDSHWITRLAQVKTRATGPIAATRPIDQETRQNGDQVR